MTEILSRDEVAKLLDCEPERIDIAARRGELPGIKYGRSWVFPHEALMAWLNDRALQDAPARQPKEKPRQGVAVKRVNLPLGRRVI